MEFKIDSIVRFKEGCDWYNEYPNYRNRLFKVVRINPDYIYINPLIPNEHFVWGDGGGGFYPESLEVF